MNEDEFVRQVKKTLDQQVDALDGETQSRLNQARQAALQQAYKPRAMHVTRPWIPIGGIAAALLLTSIFMFRSEEIATMTDTSVDEIEIMAASDNLELYEQLDFYLWLLAEDTGAV